MKYLALLLILTTAPAAAGEPFKPKRLIIGERNGLELQGWAPLNGTTGFSNHNLTLKERKKLRGEAQAEKLFKRRTTKKPYKVPAPTNSKSVKAKTAD